MSADLVLVLNLDQQQPALRRVVSADDLRMLDLPPLLAGMVYSGELRLVGGDGAVRSESGSASWSPRLRVSIVDGAGAVVDLVALEPSDFTVINEGDPSGPVGWSFTLDLRTSELLDALPDDNLTPLQVTLDITGTNAIAQPHPWYRSSTYALPRMYDPTGDLPTPLNSALAALGGLTPAADRLPYFSGPAAASLAVFTAFARTLLACADGTAVRAALSIYSVAEADAALALKAPLASPALTGTPTAPTAADGTNTTQIATTAFVKAAIDALIASAPGVLDTLKELADALGDDPNFAATMTAALALKAPLASPALTGTPTAPTAAGGTNTSQIATTAFVKAAIDALIASAPGALDTLNELAAALGNDANFAATMTAALALKAPLASPAFTGTPTAPTAAAGTNTTQLATTAFVKAAQDELQGHNAPTAISSASDTSLALSARMQRRSFAVTVNAGSAVYTATLSIANTNAAAGAEIDALVAMPASLNPTIEIRNLTSGGTLLGTLYGHPTLARNWTARLRFDGTNWSLRELTPANLRSASEDFLAEKRNALAPRGGIYVDGTSGAKIVATLTNQNIGTDDCSLCGVLNVPLSNPAANVGLLDLSAVATAGASALTANSLSVLLTTTGTIRVLLYGATPASNVIQADVTANIVTNYGGKSIFLSVTRAGGVLTISINGIAVAFTTNDFGTGYTFAGSITSTYLLVGFDGTTQVFTGRIYSVSLYNLALSAADITEIYELGGAVPYRFRWGSQVDIVNSSTLNGGFETAGGGGSDIFANWTESLGDWDVFERNTSEFHSGAASLHLKYLSSGVPTSDPLAVPISGITVGQRVRVSLWYKQVSGPSNWLQLKCGDNNNLVNAGTLVSDSTWRQLIIEVTWNNTVNSFGFRRNSGVGGAREIYIDDVRITPIGAVIHLPLTDGLGYQLRDASINHLHAVTTATGISHLLPSYGPARVRAYSSTNGNEQIKGQVLIPANAQLLRIRAKARTGTPTVTLGTASGGSQLVASVGLTSAWKDLTIALTGGQVGGSDISLWAGSNSTDVVDWDITWEPQSA